MKASPTLEGAVSLYTGGLMHPSHWTFLCKVLVWNKSLLSFKQIFIQNLKRKQFYVATAMQKIKVKKLSGCNSRLSSEMTSNHGVDQ